MRFLFAILLLFLAGCFANNREEGFANNREEGFANSREEGFANSREEGFANSREEGFANNQEECFTNANVKLIINQNKKYIPFEITKSIEVYENGKISLLINESLLLTSIAYFDNAEPVKVVEYNIFGNKVAECSIRDDKPFSGTVWSLVTGLTGLKWSILTTYENGKFISEKPYREEEMSNLLESLGPPF